jgi:hypothetical protein
MSPRERGQASVELVGLVLLVCLALAAAGGVGPRPDPRSLGGFLSHHIVCAVTRACHATERALERAYGHDTAALLREHAPNLLYEPGERELPVDWRDCRRPSCANAPDDPALDAHVGGGRVHATAFTRVIRRRGRRYLQYWLYYPDSNSAVAGSDEFWKRSWILPRVRELLAGTPDYPGFHRDDWEGAFVRIDPDGSAWLRASAHGHYQGCKWRDCRNLWMQAPGWVRVSRGSHAGHVPFRLEPRPRERRDPPPPPRYLPRPSSPWRSGRHIPLVPGRNVEERSTSGEGIRLIPLETLDRHSYRPLAPGVKPPWRKRAYSDPETGES